MMLQPFDVNITGELASVDVVHDGRRVTIMRDQDQNATVNPDFAMTSRTCPPFCIQPGELALGVKTIGELEVLHALKTMSDGDPSILGDRFAHAGLGGEGNHSRRGEYSVGKAGHRQVPADDGAGDTGTTTGR